VHGHIKPSNVMASGDQLKVSSDGLRRVGESPDGVGDQNAYDPPENVRGILPMSQAMSLAGDVWSLGMTLVEALTQNLPVVRTEEQQDPLIPQSLPEPLLDIAKHCLIRHPERRWTVAQIAARLKGRATVAETQATSPKIQAPLRVPAHQSLTRPPMLPANLRAYAMPIAAGLALALIAILVGPKLLRHRAEEPLVPAAAEAQPSVPPAPSQPTQASQQRSTKSHSSDAAKEERKSKAAVPVPAKIRPDTIHDEETNIAERVPTGPVVRGEVARQVIPEVPPSARNTIRGKVRVSVKVNVDRSGDVEDAELASQGPSKYFARMALNAAQNWKFKPPSVGGQGVLSSWTLRFEFTQDGATVVPAQEMP
jgi:TonB family protein